MNADPLWTAGGSWTMGLDPLGIQATSIRIYQALLPGVTNITNRLRYYAYYPWLVQLYERTQHSDVPEKWGTFVRRGEALYALAALVADTEASDGMGGSDWAGDRRLEAAEKGIDFRRFTDEPDSSDSYFQAPRGNFGNAYGPTLADLEVITATPIPVVRERGALLAGAFEQSIGSAAGSIERAVLDGQIGPAELREIGLAVHPGKIPTPSRELDIFRDFLLGRWDDDRGARARRSTAWLVLDLYRCGVTPGDQIQLRDAFYRRVLPNGEPYEQGGETIDRWRAYQANEYCHVALECALNGLLGRQLEEYPDGIEPRTLVSELVRSALGSDDDTWESWARAVSLEHRDREGVLAEPILANLRQGTRPSDELVRIALQLLAVLWVRWASGDGGVRSIVSQAAGRGGRSLDGVFRTLDECADRPVQDAAAELLHRHIVVDHQTIAGRKLSAGGTFTYHFIVEDGLLRDGRLGEYGYTTPRLGNLTRLLRDARLLDAQGVTAEGEAFLEQNQPL
ncbi:MAG: hypothetical protein ACT4N8_09900 [Sphingosinicella sp.]|uniref:hypothetical protein n=1 Tax=Sphingosinicella sp. TaxID=1917971 RepID=UPI0040381F4D